jgi:hypothetical protein
MDEAAGREEREGGQAKQDGNGEAMARIRCAPPDVISDGGQ